MKKIVTAANGVVFQPADANSWQDNTEGARRANQNNDIPSGGCLGGDRIRWQRSAGVANGAAPVLVDDSIDWRDRVLEGTFKNLLVAGDSLGGATEHNFSNTFPTLVDGYTGTGGKDAGGADPSAGNPPVLAAGKYAVSLNGATKTIWVYALGSTGALYFYNNSGGTVYPYLSLTASGDAGLH